MPVALIHETLESLTMRSFRRSLSNVLISASFPPVTSMPVAHCSSSMVEQSLRSNDGKYSAGGFLQASISRHIGSGAIPSPGADCTHGHEHFSAAQRASAAVSIAGRETREGGLTRMCVCSQLAGQLCWL